MKRRQENLDFSVLNNTKVQDLMFTGIYKLSTYSFVKLVSLQLFVKSKMLIKHIIMQR